MTTSSTSAEGYRRLKKALEMGNCVAFVGSGPSTGEGPGKYKSWPNLIHHLCAECGLVLDDKYKKRSLKPTILMLLAEAAKELNPTAYRKALADEYAGVVSEVPNVYRTLFDLPFFSHVTLNFDPLLGHVGGAKARTVYAFPDLPIAKLEEGIFYLHGRVEAARVPTRDALVLSTSDFERAYHPKQNDLYSFLKQLFMENPVVFIGCSLGEPQLRQLFASTRKLAFEREVRTGIPLPSRFILRPHIYFDPHKPLASRRIDTQQEEKENASYLRSDITVVRYPNEDDTHTGLGEMLDSLFETVSPPPNQFEEPELL